MKKKQLFSLIVVLLLIIALFLNLDLVKKVQLFLGEALGKKANIVVDVSIDQGPVEPIWQALAQGGEEKNPFDEIISEITLLKPKYIRIDHLYDFYDVVRRENEKLKFNWSQLDQVVDHILKTGAIPFLSLSYMPPAISSGDITDPPQNWREWQLVVQKTIEHFSGRNQRNLTNVYYEVWNEPDLFGNWKIGRSPNYSLLYHYAVLGANQARNTNPFKIGGPGTTSPYRNWVNKFLNYIVKNNLRLDFYSWHRYSARPREFLIDINRIDTWLFQRAGATLPKFLTEWGSNSENSPWHDSRFDAAHLVAVIRQLIQRVDLAFVFEIKDGPDPSGKKYWGRWGLFTHEKAGPIEKKPKYYALQLLNKMGKKRIKLEGEGTWVTGFATKEDKKIKIILTNFDPKDRHFETVPLTINNLESGRYFYKESFLSGISRAATETITTGTLEKEVSLSPNDVVLIELVKS